jgi:hypothetical protein
MNNLLVDLDDRKSELDGYLKLIEFLDSSTVITNEDNVEFQASSHLLKTTKGTVYLILYNLIESTMREAIVKIHEKISVAGVSFDSLRLELQKKIIQRAKKDKTALATMLTQLDGNISLNIHNAALRKEDIFSGNIDRKEITNVASIYGFNDTTDYHKTKNGRHLTNIKDNRNDLAHGNKTFSEVGSNKSASELKELCDEVIFFMYEIFDNMIDSVESQKYLKA